MRLLVTGGAGFIGSHVCARAAAAGWEVLALDDLSNGKRENLPPGVDLAVVDIRDANALEEVLTQFRPQVVSHQAAQASVSVSVRDPNLDVDVNVVGSLRVLEACRRHGTERLVFASTGGAIYGEIEAPARAGEDWRPRPETPYAASKLAVEGYLDFYRARGLACTSLRYANVYGPRQDPHGEAGVVAIFVQRLLAGQGVQVNAMHEPGDDGCVRDYVYVDDVAQANLAALRGEIDLPVLNVGTGEGTSTRALLDAIVRHLRPHLDGTPEVADTPHRDGDVLRSVLDVAAFRSQFPDTVPLDDGIARTVEAFVPTLPKDSTP